LDERASRCRIILKKTIILSKSQKDTLVNHAKRYAPNESCAILFGHEDSNTVRVTEIFLAENIEKSPVNFTISNEELLKGYKLAEQKKLDVVGIFHSHPHSEAVPSSTDREFMQVNPVVWLIFSNKTDDLRAYDLETEIVVVAVKTV
jgi:proteasome lid subunit RPN8/RPN11